MTNKKYVIMRHFASVPDENCPIVEADDNKRIKKLQKEGYKIVGRATCNENFTPCYARLRKVKNEAPPAAERTTEK